MGRKLAVSLALLLFLVIAAWAIRLAMEARATSTLRAQLDALLQEARGRSGERPVLRGTPQPGRAWDKYAEAARSADPIIPFREGLLRKDGQRYRKWEGPESYPSTTFLERVSGPGAPPGSELATAELLLDLLQFCGDLSRNGSVEDWSFADTYRLGYLETLWLGIQLWRFAPEDWDRLARELELLDRGLPSVRDVLLNSAMSRGCMYVDVSRTKSLLAPDVPLSWRQLYSERIAVTSAFLTELDCFRRIAETAEAPWDQAQATVAEAQADFDASKNPILLAHAKGAAEGAGNLLRSARLNRARLRLLRMACLWRANHALSELDDPFGGKLRCVVDRSGAIKAWSRGPDGADDGGRGSWKREGPDVVLECGP